MNIKRRVRRLFRPRSSEKAPNSTGKRRSGSGAPPPPLKDGWTTGPPDYIGIGVQKAGTTRWWKLIVKHPDVVGWQLKETHQLSRFGWRPLFDEDRETYYRYFPRPEGKIVGEWTPRYMNVPGVVDTTTNFVEHPDLVAQRIDGDHLRTRRPQQLDRLGMAVGAPGRAGQRHHRGRPLRRGRPVR